jgi:hypothetical protein
MAMYEDSFLEGQTKQLHHLKTGLESFNISERLMQLVFSRPSWYFVVKKDNNN